MHVGIFGGSFNPPHIAHLIVAEQIRDRYRLDRIVWIPSFQPPHKQVAELAPFEHRFEMTRLAVERNAGFEVSDVEYRMGGVSYTVMTIRALQEASPDTTFSLLLGGDSMATFDAWYRPDEILERVELIVYGRPGYELPASIEGYSNRIHVVDAPLIEVSAEQIRAMRRKGRSIRYLVPEPVLAYIEKHGLYQ